MLFHFGLVGIDIGTQAIKAVQLDTIRKKYVLKKCAKVNNTIRKTSFSDESDRKALTTSLKGIAESFTCKRCVVGIPSTHVIFRNLQLPRMKLQELKEAVYWEAQEFSSMFDEDYVSDFELLEVQENNCRVMLAGTLNNIVLDYLTVIENAGFKVEAVDVYPLAISRIIQLAGINDVTAVVDIGYSHCEITIIEKGVVFFSRVVSINSPDLINMSSSSNNYPGTSDKEGYDILVPSLQELMLEISRFFDFYSIQRKGHKVDSVIFIGCGSRLWCLEEIYSDYFSLPVIDAAKICHKFIDIGEIQYDDWDLMEYFNAIGFALRR
jgi:type IV pilus assembly protein PilM